MEGRGASFRHSAPDVGVDALARPRLIELLRRRFERRLTVLVAGAGFGKTTLLAQAVQENRTQREGIDAWLHLNAADADAGNLLAGLVGSLGGAPVHPVSVDDVVDQVWSMAPESIALVLDDTHLLEASAPAWAALQELLDRLPANGHLVLAGRQRPPVSIGRLLAAGDAVVVEEEALAFTDDELRSFGERRMLPPEQIAELPPWPALAALTSAAGGAASSGYLWEEVLSALPDERRQLLALASAFEVIDDLVVTAVDPAGAWTASRLVAGLPLVDADGRGAHRLHSLWLGALDGIATPAARRTALEAGAEALLAAGEHRRAAEAWAAAGDADGLHRAVRVFATQPISRVDVPDVVALLQLLPPDLRVAPIGTFLDAARHWTTSARQALVLFERAVDRAEADGDEVVESLARWRQVQLQYLDRPELLEVTPRMEELAASGVPLGRSTPAFVRSVRAQRAGDARTAVAELDAFDGFDPDQRLAATSWRLLDLGRPESMPGSLDTMLGPSGIELVNAQAVWFRGEIDPETAWAFASGYFDVSGRRGVTHEQVSILAIIAMIGLAAGQGDDAARLVASASKSVDLVGREVAQLVAVAEAQLLLATDGDEAARARFEQSLAEVPLGRWPNRAHLYSLAALRALVPAAAVLDDCDLGPACRVAVAAGRAVVALREADDRTPASALPWGSPTLLRAHVPPPLLAELAVAAAPTDPRAAEVLEVLPDRRRWLRRIAAQSGALGAAATEWVGASPERPPYDVRVRTLGRFEIGRSDGVAVAPDWSKRERVRQLLGQLVLRRRVARAEIAALLWPDLPSDKAAANLRVNLRHLQQVLQPDRPADAARFVRTEDDALVLADEGIRLDVAEFDEQVTTAVRSEAAGLPSIALEALDAAGRLYGGDFLPGLDDPDLDLERLRLRTLAHSSACRRGELVLARGEPEAAMLIATEASRLDPLSERAYRLSIRCHLALGSGSGARDAGLRLLDALGRIGAKPDDETTVLLRRLQLS